MYRILNGNYTWFSSKATEMQQAMKECLSKAGFEVVGFYPGLASLCGSGESCKANLIIETPHCLDIESLNEVVLSDDFINLSGFTVESSAWLHPDIVRCLS